MDDLLPTIEVESAGNPRFSVIWLHGLSADGSDFVPVVPELALPADAAARFVFPHAPRIPVTCNGGYVMRAWYDIVSLASTSRSVDHAGVQRPLGKGAEIGNGDTVRTGEGGRAQLRFTDGAMVSLQPQSEFRIDDYQYAGQTDGQEKGFFSLLKGGLRTITGWVGRTHRENYKVTTNVATIGIRGTEFLAGLNPQSSDLESGNGTDGRFQWQRSDHQMGALDERNDHARQYFGAAHRRSGDAPVLG